MQSHQPYVDYYFLEGLFQAIPPVKYSCPICLSPVQREAFLTQCCGNHFCFQCISRMVKAAKSCPMCKFSPLAIFPNKERQREIKSLQVCCPAGLKDRNETEDKTLGDEQTTVMQCDWLGELGHIDDHLKDAHKDDKRWKACVEETVPPSQHGPRKVCLFHLNQSLRQMGVSTQHHHAVRSHGPINIHVHGASGTNVATSFGKVL